MLVSEGPDRYDRYKKMQWSKRQNCT
jgi:hypothetical protein